uniref:Kelch domain containing 8A n=1 Tax=Anser brachyrhynchus TaxID=132585 RepID=A0A8B9BGG6_9AVES
MEVANSRDFQWKTLAPLPSRRVYSTLVEAGGQVFAIGGCDDNGVPMDCFEVYSPEADQWTALPPMPTARAGVAVATLGKRIMVIGGVGVNQTPLKIVEMYNVDEGKWKKRNSLREAAMGISVTAKDYRVYAAGGMGCDLRPHNYLQHYDMLKDIWVSLAAMPTPRYAATSFLRGTKIYVLGGRQSKYAINAFEVFDTETRSWTKFPNIPNKRAFSSFVPTEDKLFSLGGLRQGRLYRQPKFMRTVDVFDIEQGGWMKMERSFYLKKRRADFVAGYLKGRVVVAGGLGEALGTAVTLGGRGVLLQSGEQGKRTPYGDGLQGTDEGCWPVLPASLCVPREPADRPGVGGGLPPREEQVGEPAPDAHPALRLLQHRGQELPAGGRRGEPGAEQRGGSPLRLRFLTDPSPRGGTPLPAGAGPAPGGAELCEHCSSRPGSLALPAGG